MSKLKILLVDDEFLALRLLENFVQQIPDLEIVAKIKSPIKALEILNQQHIDILFLDIQMPILSGLKLLEQQEKAPVTIFTTAYSEYAVSAFDLGVVDYLLKPFSFERFQQAIDKAKGQLQVQLVEDITTAQISSNDFISIKSDSKTHKVFLDEILFIEGFKEYLKIITSSKKIVTLDRMKHYEHKLPTEQFLRVHKSYIVNTRKASAIKGNFIIIESYKIPVSRGRKKEIVQQIFGEPV